MVCSTTTAQAKKIYISKNILQSTHDEMKKMTDQELFGFKIGVWMTLAAVDCIRQDGTIPEYSSQGQFWYFINSSRQIREEIIALS